MIKTTTFKINNSNTAYSFPTTDYSKALDNIIAANLKATNTYLNDSYGKKDDLISALLSDAKKENYSLFSSSLNKNDEFLKAANFLANYDKKSYTKIPFIIGKTYKLIDGTPICFYDDEIQIGYDIYSYDNFSNINFLKTLSEPKKKIIINIFNAGNKNITINIH